MPKGVDWLKESVVNIDPEHNCVETDQGEYFYKYLVVATGIVPDWGYAEGLQENIGKNGVCSVYTYDTCEQSFEELQKLNGGELIFTMPKGLLKCGGAPQKIMWLSEDYCSRFKNREEFNIHFVKEGQGIFGVQKYKEVLDKLVLERNINTHYEETLVDVNGLQKIATFKDLDGNEKKYPYDLLHVVPHFQTHSFISECPLSNDRGEVEVDAKTLQSTKFKNVFSLGDCSSCPTGKTGAAIRKEAPVLVENLHSYDQSKPLSKEYNGYTACPILTRHNRVLLAEFDYDGNPMESFPFDQAKESFLMYLFKRYLLPWLYWNLMLKGLI
jgi:sulfide:quinone oxidoreductase